MDDQNPLNPLLGSIFPNAQVTVVPGSEGGQLQAPIVPGVGGEGLKPIEFEQIQVPEVVKVEPPAKQVEDICPGCHDPYCNTYSACRRQGMQAGMNPDNWMREPRSRAPVQAEPVQAQAEDADQLYLCPNCGSESCLTTIMGRMMRNQKQGAGVVAPL